MTEEEKKDNLLKSPLFRDLPPERLDTVVAAVQMKSVARNGTVFRKGDPADAFYIVGSGKIRIFVTHESGIERDLAVLGPGEHFGEVALLTGEGRTANVDALSETILLFFAKDDFDRLLKDFPELARVFMKDMRKWLIKDQEIIEEEVQAVFEGSRLSWFDFVMVLGISILLAVSFNLSNPNGIPLLPAMAEKGSIPLISAPTAMEEYKKGNVLILDAMPANFYAKRHIAGAVNMPMALFDIVYLMNFPEEDDKERKILVYGSTISRPYDMEIAAKLLLRGYSDVKIIEGGLSAWEAQGYPVEEKGAK